MPTRPGDAALDPQRTAQRRSKPVPVRLQGQAALRRLHHALGGSKRVVQADLPLLGSFAGALLGLPSESIQHRVAEPRLDDLLRDAIHEVLNVASTVVCTTGRAVFQDFYNDPVYLPKQATLTMNSPLYRSYFNVTMEGYEGGAFSLFAHC